MKKENGITLITLVAAIVVMLIIVGTMTANSIERFELTTLQDRNSDISVLQTKIAIFYAQNKKLPILTDYIYTTGFLQDKNPNDNEEYKVIDLEQIDGLSLKLGRGYYDIKKGRNSEDVYIINTKTHTIYYAKGITVKGEISYKNNSNNETILENNQTVNAPEILEGMTPVKWDNSTQQWIETTYYDEEWYKYTSKKGESKWANAKTADGSLWVWIPRFAYSITKGYQGQELSYIGDVTSEVGQIQIKFLKGTTNETIDGESITIADIPQNGNWIVHPAFQSGKEIGYANGEGEEEISGFWVAKFEAGYNGEKENAEEIKDSNVKYTTVDAITIDGYVDNVDNYYGNRIENQTFIKYPIFIEGKPSMNYISVGDAFNLCMNLTESENPYQFGSKVDSHLMKNSEWGAIAYLTNSIYGINNETLKVNETDTNISGIYAITGGGDYIQDNVEQSTTGNVYGIYDLSGGLWEMVSAYGTNNSSTAYVTGYTIDTDNSQNNFENENNQKKKGDALQETSKFGTLNSSWQSDYSEYIKPNSAFFKRGGYKSDAEKAGIYAYGNHTGIGNYSIGFRACLTKKNT